jgi:L,D-transpeptidase catalytic domain
MKKYFLIATLLITSFLVTAGAWYLTKFKKPATHTHTAAIAKKIAALKADAKLYTTVAAAKLFTKNNQYNSQVCFLINMSAESGSNRFFVYNLKTDSIVNMGLVTHGRCNQNWLIGRQYGNKVGCGCTSLGKYKIGAPYYGKFGLAYKLHGLDSTNNNAFKRFVVLHSHECVPSQEVSPAAICQSDGCPTVAPDFLKQLQTVIDRSTQPILLWIYE